MKQLDDVMDVYGGRYFSILFFALRNLFEIKMLQPATEDALNKV